jgi:CheY-like chemotaxis protein
MENSNIEELLLYSKKIKTGSSIFLIPENLDLKSIDSLNLCNNYKIYHIEEAKNFDISRKKNYLNDINSNGKKHILITNISITNEEDINNFEFINSNTSLETINTARDENNNILIDRKNDRKEIPRNNYLKNINLNFENGNEYHNEYHNCSYLNTYCELLKKILNNLEIKWDWANKTFLSNLSHQLKTPLTGILTGIQILDSRLQNNYDRHIIESLFKSCLELSTYISDISEYYFISHNDIEVNYTSFNIKNTIYQIINIFDLQLETNNTCFIYDINKEHIRDNIIYQDKEKIFKILYNLINNSIKFTRDGKIKLEIFISSDNEKYYFRLFDNGKKINDEDKHNIFEPFYQINNQWTTTQDGMGLGLSICHKIINSLNGNIYFSEYNDEFHNCFEFWVPIEKKNIVNKNENNDETNDQINNDNNNINSDNDENNIDNDDNNINSINSINNIENFFMNKINKIDEQIKNDINKINLEFVKRDTKTRRRRSLPKPPTFKKNNLTSIKTNILKNNNNNILIPLNILIIEDHKLNSNLICLMIKELIGNQHNIDIINNSSYAIDKILHNNYDFILLDLKMPQISGFDILKKLKQINYNMKATKIIIITALICQTVNNLIVEYPDIDIIYKPIQGIDLKEKLMRNIKNIKDVKNIKK